MSATPTSTSISPSTTTPCVTAIPDKHGYVPPDACNANYMYDPSFAAAIIFSVVFGILLFIHLLQAFVYKKKFCWVIIMGASWESCSFILRTVSTRHQQQTAYVIISQILLLLAPLWINAFDYMILGRMVHFFLPEQKVFRVRAARFSTIFIWLDIVSFLTQAAGGSILSGTNESSKEIMLGIHIYMGGIGLQELFILLFTILVIQFHREVLILEKQGVLAETGKERWRSLVYTLYASLLLITIRIIYRLVEFAGGVKSNNPLPYHEAFLYCLDALPMVLALFIMCLWHPGRTLVGPDSEFPKLSRKEKKAIKKAKKAEKLELEAKKKAEKAEKQAAKKYGYGQDAEVGRVSFIPAV